MKQRDRSVIVTELALHDQDMAELQAEIEASEDAMADFIEEEAMQANLRQTVISGHNPETGVAYETQHDYRAAVEQLDGPLSFWERGEFNLRLALLEDLEIGSVMNDPILSSIFDDDYPYGYADDIKE